MSGKRLRITDTVLRDAHQSLLATRMRLKHMEPILSRLDEVGYWSVEMWGGATFDSALRFLNEDPWERIRTIRKHMPNTRLQMLLRGQNIVGYRHYPDDIVEKFVKHAHANGIDVFRIFDALNDERNMRTSIKTVNRVGAVAEAAISYTISPVHNIESYVKLAQKLADLGADIICIKDMAGLISPFSAYELVSQLKKKVGLPVHLHAHCTSGMATASILKAVEAGVDIVDTAVSSMSEGTSQPPTETIVAQLQGTPYDTGMDLNKFTEIAEYFREVRKQYSEFESAFTGIDTNVLRYQIPGGMISNLAKQLKDQNAWERMNEVLAEGPRVREDLGYPPLVTPSSQIVGTQATLNVLVGERYKMVTKETKDYIKGLYGKPPAPIKKSIIKKVIGSEKRITCRPADLLKPEFAHHKKSLGKLAKSDEDVLSYALFPTVALEYFEKRGKAGDNKGFDLAEVAAMAAVISEMLTTNSKPKPTFITPQGGGSDPWAMAGRAEQLGLRKSGWYI
ncbi:MAG: pyruvate/oxaloacetate carboxyltransferase [Thermoplasmata archaeon]|nr:MAG: pyruvate/oxaloacetate carboxyltransferase [Thermoplasmata archaeon]